MGYKIIRFGTMAWPAWQKRGVFQAAHDQEFERTYEMSQMVAPGYSAASVWLDEESQMARSFSVKGHSLRCIGYQALYIAVSQGRIMR